VPYLVGSGPALALDYTAKAVYSPTLNVTLPITVTNVGNEATFITITVSTHDALGNFGEVYSQTIGLNVPAGGVAFQTLTVLPTAVPGRYTSSFYLGGEAYDAFDFAVAAEDTLFADIYPHLVYHNVGDSVTLTVQIMNASYTYTDATAEVILFDPLGVTQTVPISKIDTGRYQGQVTSHITGTYLTEVEVTKPGYRVIGNATFFIAGERSRLRPTVSGKLIVGESNPLTVTVRNEWGTPIPEAWVTISGTEEFIGGHTDSLGQLVLWARPSIEEYYRLSVRKKGFVQAEMMLEPEVVSDITPPFIFLDVAEFTNHSPITVSGTTEPSVILTINGQPISVDASGLFTAFVPLSEGDNLITAQATDQAQNTTTITRTVTLDIIPPALTITSPEEGAVVESEVITVVGSTEIGASLTISGTITTVEEDGSFGAWLILKPGVNIIPIVSTDAAGNSTTIMRTVTYHFLEETKIYLPIILKNR
jgi:hypothetical protein